MKLNIRWVLAVCGGIVLGGLLAGGIAQSAPPKRVGNAQCAYNSDCQYPLVCSAQFCRAQCIDSRDCTGGWVCFTSGLDSKGQPDLTTNMCVDPRAVNIPRSPQEPNMNYGGSDITSIILPVNDPLACDEACRATPACKMWTFVKPGVQGALPRCWLKNAIPAGRADTCCVSGKKV